MTTLTEDLNYAREQAIARMFLNLVADVSEPDVVSRGKQGLRKIVNLHETLVEHVKSNWGDSK